MKFEEIKEFINEAWSDVEKDFLEYLEVKKIPAIKIKFDVVNDMSWNMKSNTEKTYGIFCCHGIYDGISKALEVFNIEENKKDKCTFTLLKMIMWHEVFHVCLGHKITGDEKKVIRLNGDEIVLQQLEYIADGMAIRNYMPFIITNKDENMTNEYVMAQFLTLLYVYYLKMDELERNNGKPTEHPCSNVRLELLLMCSSRFISEWNKCVPQETIDERYVRDLCTMNLRKADLKEYIAEIYCEEEIQKIVNISYNHWIWEKCISPIDDEFRFKK